jgi:hypothetical protein
MGLGRLTQTLFAAWRRGGVWDEARPEPEILRAPPDAREASPSRVLRELVISALAELGEGGWIPWSSFRQYLLDDARLDGVARLLRRWADRVSVDPPSAETILRRIVLETLPGLGLLDVGYVDVDAPTDAAVPVPKRARLDAGDEGVSLRLNPRGRWLFTGALPSAAPPPSKFVDTHALRLGGGAAVGHVLALSPFADVGRVEEQLDLVLTPSSLSRALSAGVDGEALRARIEAVAPLPDSISQMLSQASAVLGRTHLVRASGFLWVDDPELRELLRTRRPAADLFLDPSPPGGLLVAPEVDVERLTRRCRALGVVVEAHEDGLKAMAPDGPSHVGSAAPPGRPPRGSKNF